MGKEADLKAIAQKLRHHAIVMTTRAGSGHPTTCMSMAEIMACLFFNEMRYDIKNPNNPGNDEFVLSKGHASPILWATFAEAGIIKFKELEGYRQYGSRLEGHPTPNMPWIKAATGSLGQGLSVGLGMALAMQLEKLPTRAFVVLGDGECAEGSVWEAVELAPKVNASNLVAIVDCNRLGQSGESLHGHDIKQWEKKFSAFGWNTAVIDGHSVQHVLKALSATRTSKKPSVIIAKTFKGKGVSFVENKEGHHGVPFKPDEMPKALKELEPIRNVNAKKLVKKAHNVKRRVLKKRSPKPPNYKPGDKVASRGAYGVMLEKLGVDDRIVALDGDVKNSTYSEKFKNKYPKRFVECFIAEQNMVGIAAGFSAKGFIPFASTFGTFFTRAHDQIRMAAYSRANLKLCGSHVGVSIGMDGPSQMGLEDLAMMRCIPGSIVLYPSDAVSAEKCTELMVEHKGISYLRTSRPKTPILYKNNESFKIGGSKVVRKGSGKVVIITAGVTLHEALKVADKMKSVTVIDAYSVKPLDERTIRSAAKGRKVLVVEDHYPEGGLGEAVNALGIPITHLAVRDIPRSGSPEDLMRAYKVDAAAIMKAAKKLA